MYNNLMNAVCPSCGESVKDTQNGQVAACENCGYKTISELQNEAVESDSTDQEYTHQSGISPKETEFTFISIFGVISNLAILFFILVLLVNFISYFPAFAITAHELVNEHYHELETRVPIILDSEPPEIEYAGETELYLETGQVYVLSAGFSDHHLKECYLESSELGNNRTRFILNSLSNTYQAQFQAPEEPGNYNLTIFAKDYANNLNSLDLEIIVTQNSKPFLQLKSPKDFNIINSLTELTFQPWGDNISSVSYKLKNSNESHILSPWDSISTNTWPQDKNELIFNIKDKNGGVYNQSFSILIDDTKPELNEIQISPLTTNRNETFRDRLGTKYFYRGELVRITLNITEPNLVHANVSIKNREYLLVRHYSGVPQVIDANQSNPDTAEYQTVLSLPPDPGEYTITFSATDQAGNQRYYSRELKVARVNFNYYPIPILELKTGSNTSSHLPYINEMDKIQIVSKYGDIEKIEYIIPDSMNKTLLSSNTINVSELQTGLGYIVTKGIVKYVFFDLLFISLPFPPYLFILPIILTGWSLLGFYIFIACSIILSNLILFRKSIVGAFKEINKSFSNLKGPPIRSKNSILMVSQLFIATLSFQYFYQWLLQLNQVETHVPDFSSLSSWALIHGITTASVYEEIISRTLLIGLPLLVLHLILQKVKKPTWRYIFGGEFEINKITIFLIIFSSITFGLAHSPGWDYWKVLPSLVTGLALGYLYVTKGLYASIILHFSVNFLSIPLLLSNYLSYYSFLLSIFIIIWIAIGFCYIIYYLKIIVDTPFKNHTSN